MKRHVRKNMDVGKMKGISQIDENNITILHLSDFHFNENNKTESDTVVNALFDDLQKLRDDDGVNPNLIVISGDIADTADHTDYHIALEILNNLLEQLKISPGKVFIVPGNHDINRDALRPFSTLKFNNEEDVTKFLTKNESEKNAVFKKLSNFYEFVKNFYGEKNPYETNNDYISTLMPIGKYKIGIVGLNTVWYSGERRLGEENIIVDEKSLFVGEIQVKNAYDNVKNTDFCITIMHHPFSWLSDYEEEIIKRLVMKNSKFIFHGHTHTSSLSDIHEPDSRCIRLSAGTSSIKNKDKRYSICKINLQDLSYEVYLRRFSEENKFWAKDTLTYQKGEGCIRGKFKKTSYEHPEVLDKEYPFEEPNHNIESYVKNNWKHIILTESYERDKILESRHNFFNQFNFNPSLHDIALQTIQYLLERRLIRTKRDLENIISKFPYINTHLQEFEKHKILFYFDDKYFEEQNKKIVFSSRDEIVKLKEREFLLKKENEMIQRIEEKIKGEYKEKEQELDRRKEEIESEYNIFKSKIDNYPSLSDDDLPSINKRVSIPQRGMWYDELGMKENPFPSHIGLEGIDEKLWDDVIVKTDIFHRFDFEILNSPQSLIRKSFLIYGVRGSGKTTLFKYLEKTISVLIPNTLSIIIPLEAQSDYERIKYDFYQKLYVKLETEYFSITKSPTGMERNALNDSSILFLFQQITQATNVTNYVVFIEDLHQHPTHIYSAFEFISGLQIFRSYMYENGINLTIFLSGDIAWISNADGVKTIGGSIDSKEKISAISEKNAVEMINNRLKVFAKNPENPPIIKPEYISTVFKILKARMPLEVTFRDVLEEIEKHLMNYEFESLKLHVILDFNTLSTMMLDLESDHPSIKTKIDNLWGYADKDENIFNRFTEAMQTLYLKGTIYEDDYDFKNNEEYYGYLYKAGLISKQRKDYYFVWVLTKEIKDMFIKFNGKYGFKPSEYLSKIYLKDEIDRVYLSEESSRMNMILKTGGTYGDRFLGNMKEALDNYKKVFKYITSIQETYNEEPIDICKKSIMSLMKAIITVCESRNIEKESFYEIYEDFVDSWFENTDLTEFVDILQKKDIKETPLDNDDVKEICRDYFRAIKTMISNLQRFMKYNIIFTLDSRFIHNQDKRVLNDIRRNLFNENYILALDKINSLMKNKLIELMYTINCLIYGVDKWKRGLTQEINTKFMNIVGKDSNEKSVLNNINLVDLASAYLNMDEITERICSTLFGNETWKVFKRGLLLEKELLTIYLGDTTNRPRGEILSYIMQAKLFVDGVDSFYYRLFSNEIPFLMNYRNFGISLKSEDKRLNAYDVKDDIVHRIKSQIDTDGGIELDFSVYMPTSSFPTLNFIDWIMYIYHMNSNLKVISINLSPNGKVIIS